MVCEGVVVRQEDVQINKVRVQSGQTAYLRSGLLLMKLFLTLCVLVVQVLNLTAVGCGTASVWAQVVRPARQASLGMVCEGVVVRPEGVQINKVRIQSAPTAYMPLSLLLMKLFLTLCVLVVQVLKPKLVGLATASAWAQVVRPARQASLRMVCECLVVRQEDAQINK
ncbi:hypothetical protein PR003_g34457, partial [Phytophthora rubi]